MIGNIIEDILEMFAIAIFLTAFMMLLMAL
jgi:hypothetical protein